MRSLIMLIKMEQKECLLLLEIVFARKSTCILFVTLPALALISEQAVLPRLA